MGGATASKHLKAKAWKRVLVAHRWASGEGEGTSGEEACWGQGQGVKRDRGTSGRWTGRGSNTEAQTLVILIKERPRSWECGHLRWHLGW